MDESMPTIIRGTTPTHVFDVDMNLTTAEEIYITYRQSKGRTVEKTLNDISVSEDQISTHLTQADTLVFSPYDGLVEIQIRAKYADGSAIASSKMYAEILPVLKDGEL